MQTLKPDDTIRPPTHIENPSMNMSHRPSDVFQINEHHPQPGWVGAFVMATEIKSWGIQGFVHIIKDQDNAGKAYIRLSFDEIDYIGHAVMVPSDLTQPES